MYERLEVRIAGSVEIFQVELALFSKICFIFFNKSILEMMKNAFYFIIKAFSFFRFLNFCLDFLVMQKQRSKFIYVKTCFGKWGYLW